MTPRLHGLMAEFDDPARLIAAADRARREGFTHLDAYSPFPIEGLSEAIGFHERTLPLVVFGGGVLGALTGYGLQYYVSVIAYPINVGGRPLNSLPAFIPVTFEVTILFASLTAALGMLFMNGLPKPYHPAFNVPRFELASRDRFFLCVESRDPLYDARETRGFLESLGARGVYEVEE